MGQVASCVAMSTTWCFCTAMGSLFSSCCGNDKPSTVSPGANSGRKRSVLLFVIAMAISFAFQYGVVPVVLEPNDNATEDFSATEFAKDQATNFFRDNWLGGCTDTYIDPALQERCVGNSGVYRSMFAATLFYVLLAVTAMCKPSFNREAWPAKYVLFFFLCAATIFIPNVPLFSPIYMNVARVGGALFILLEQFILIDVAHSLNESWVKKADDAEAEKTGSGKKWLAAILVVCTILFIGSIVTIGLMFHFFRGCPSNDAFISVTLILSVIIPVVQLSGEEGSLLASAVTVSYATYLCFVAVSRNPNAACNPKLGSDDITGIVLGVGITLGSLAWTGWSYTAGKTLEEDGSADEGAAAEADATGDNTTKKDEERKVTGVVTGTSSYASNENDEREVTSNAESQRACSSQTWKLNIMLAMISCWFAMVVTSWGDIDSAGGSRANPQVGNVSMWMIIATQWLFIFLYLWTLVAPRLFPDRDFS